MWFKVAKAIYRQPPSYGHQLWRQFYAVGEHATSYRSRDVKQAIGIPTQGRPHAEPFFKTAKAVEYVDVRRYVLGANIIEHVTNSNTVIPMNNTYNHSL